MQTKPFWVKTEIRIPTTNQSLYVMTCPTPNCNKETEAPANTEFQCHKCKATIIKPVPR